MAQVFGSGHGGAWLPTVSAQVGELCMAWIGINAGFTRPRMPIRFPMNYVIDSGATGRSVLEAS
jgi:hypothetical protein